ncbi:uncharacterized protein [Pleurodeles waltl]|uniref:uncharacterized protein n=1 Tax=Pleurodeles waltl TaxID=8319 RepID=UPI003709B559
MRLDHFNYAGVRKYMVYLNVYAQQLLPSPRPRRSFYTSQASLIALPDASVRDAILSIVWAKIAPYFYFFSPDMWKEWFQTLLPLVIQGINETQISELRTDATCASYHEIVTGFNMVHNELPLITIADIYNIYIKNYLEENAAVTGVTCANIDPLGWIEENLGIFLQLTSFEELLTSNQNFKLVDAEGRFTPSQLADWTLIAEHFCNETISRFVFSQIMNFKTLDDVNHYLERLQGMLGTSENYSVLSPCDNPSAMPSLTIETEQGLLSSLFVVLGKEWSLLSASQWTHIFHTIIIEYQEAVNVSHLTQLPLNVSCETYQAIMKDLNEIYEILKKNDAISNYTYSLNYLYEQQSSQGTACTKNTNGTEDWLEKNFGKFYSSLTILNLLTLYPSLSLDVILEKSTPEDVAKLVTDSAISLNISLLNTMLSLMEAQDVPHFLQTFMSETSKVPTHPMLNVHLTVSKIGWFCNTKKMKHVTIGTATYLFIL